ncbi:perforin-1-like [Hyla sarda]|uniref:perforin-1-like n=1 Tax=Hyla sarda TaxID=327740 RepID=UPI0024C3B841|nr:perforin-1-like [Hyla sarda]
MESKLYLLFWLLLLDHQRPSMSTPILRAGCRPGTSEECKDARFVPGHTLLGEGINIVTMESTGSFLLDLQEVGEKCTLCRNPHNNNNMEKLPKALVDWRPETTCSKNIQSSVSRSKVSVADEATSTVQNDWKIGLNVNVYAVDVKTAVGGSQSQMAKFANSKSLTDNYSFLSHKLECAFYSFRLGSNASLTSHFQKSLEELPGFYNKAEYRRLIDSFGTHYITRVKVGGRTQEVTAVRTCQLAMSGFKMDEVKDCLSVEAEIGVNKGDSSASIDSKVEHCKNKLSKTDLGKSFHQTFSESVSKVIGGNATFDLLSTNKASTDVFKKWIESLKTFPGLVSYSLESIHNLVKTNGSKKENLKLAISDYIKEKALSQKCSCPGRHVTNQGKDCSCTCSASKYTSSDCCPTHRGAAKLHVTIKSATGLYGDYWTQTDAYVIFKFDDVSMRTPTIMDKNKPTWNKKYELGLVELRESRKYTIEVWDEDPSDADDLLGKCQKVLISGEYFETCYLNHGSLSYSVNAACVDHLHGQVCHDYSAVPPRA